uniref:Tubulin-folding cofactor B-like n=1 Tax=Cyprinus carpio TaxID=7962 RepID=A0A8C2ERG1_CYPCA
MDGSVTVITSPTVSVRVTSTVSDFEANRRFNRGVTIAEFKSKLELIVGTPAAYMDLELFSTSDKLLQKLDNNEALLGSYHITHIISAFIINVRKYLTFQFSYLSDSIRSFKKNFKLGRFNEENGAKQEEALAKKEEEEKVAAGSIAVGNRCKVEVAGQPTKIGTVMFVGTPDFKPGYWVGVKYDEPLGKNDGSVKGKRYFECEPKHGAFVKPLSVIVGDFPEEDFGLDEM